jgi:hypothetical protein
MRLCLHLGPHRTASTHLQRALGGARPAMGRAGVALLLPQDLRGDGLPLEAVAAGTAPPEDVARLRAGCAPGAGGLILSEENLLGPALRRGLGPLPYPRAPERLARLLAAAGWEAPVRLLLALRQPADWIVSLWSQRLIAGHGQPFEVFAEGLAPAALGWSELIARLLAVPGVAGADLWRFADYPAVLPALAARALPPEAAAAVRPADAHANPGLSARAAAVIAAAPGGDRDARKALAAVARARFPVGPDAPPLAPWSPAQLTEAAAAHAEDLARLAALPGVTLLAPEAAPDPHPDP